MCTGEIPHTLLLVDDDEGIRDSLADYLGEEGYNVVTAIHGSDALVKLRSGVRPCVILLDLMMPVMSGPEFYHAQQADPALADIPVVIISADANAQSKAAALSGYCLAKPMKIDQVLEAVEQHCAGS